jgi:hypothetical protein
MNAQPDDDVQDVILERGAYLRCIRELQNPDPDYPAAQIYATLSVEEAIRDLGVQLARLTRALVVASRRR